MTTNDTSHFVVILILVKVVLILLKMILSLRGDFNFKVISILLEMISIIKKK